MGTTIKLIIGLGNPGADYEKTRHNAGGWLVEILAQQAQTTLTSAKKLHGLSTTITLGDSDCRLFIPTTFMNHSGQAVNAMMKFYRLTPEEIIVAHDDLDLPAGVVKLKTGGGHGGHNGLRDIIQHIGKEFHRIRIGIGHPGHRDRVHDYVLSRPSIADKQNINNAMMQIMPLLPMVLQGNLQKAMTTLHTLESDNGI